MPTVPAKERILILLRSRDYPLTEQECADQAKVSLYSTRAFLREMWLRDKTIELARYDVGGTGLAFQAVR